MFSYLQWALTLGRIDTVGATSGIGHLNNVERVFEFLSTYKQMFIDTRTVILQGRDFYRYP
jgi:hypothetical protein